MYFSVLSSVSLHRGILRSLSMCLPSVFTLLTVSDLSLGSDISRVSASALVLVDYSCIEYPFSSKELLILDSSGFPAGIL